MDYLVKEIKKMIRIVQVQDDHQGSYFLNERLLNSEEIVDVEQDRVMKRLLQEKASILPNELNVLNDFCKVVLRGGRVITVVGSVSSIEEKIQKGKRLLRG